MILINSIVFLGIFLIAHSYYKNFQFSFIDYIVQFSAFLIIFLFNFKNKKIFVEKKVKELYNAIANDNYEKFIEIIETKFKNIKEVQDCQYHVKY